jgi:hypothetical protein
MKYILDGRKYVPYLSGTSIYTTNILNTVTSFTPLIRRTSASKRRPKPRALHRNTDDGDLNGALKDGSARRPSWSDSLPPKHVVGSTCD